MRAEFGLSDAALGALVSAVTLCVGLAALPVAVLVDRVPRGRAIARRAAARAVARLRSRGRSRPSRPTC